MVKVMNEEEIRCCINITTLDGKLPYKKLLKEMKKEHLVGMCYELLKEHLALLDIKEYIEKIFNQRIEESKIKQTSWDKTLYPDETNHILDIVNNALGSDNNE